MDYQIRVADFAFAFVARSNVMATVFEMRVLVGRATPCALGFGGAEDCPPYPLTTASSEPIGVRKLLQNRIMPRWSEVFDHATKYWIEQSAGMSHIEIERH